MLIIRTSALAVAALLFALGWYWAGRPVEVPGGLVPGERLQCASYTPFSGDETPAAFTVEPARVARDFALLAPQVACVRIYSMKGMAAIPALARAHRLQLIAGAWISRDDADTEREIAALIRMANDNPDVIREVLVGNEVLLRRERNAAQLAGYIGRVRAAVRQPVSYGDVWEFWLQNPELAASVDFVTIHLLPYWENQPSGIDGAIAAVAHAHAAVAHAFPGKRILIGETGWPSEGRRREDAQPGRVNEARFVRGFVARAAAEGWSYNLIEAFDQPWKRWQEGAVGGYWGLFDAERVDKGILRGPVSDLPQWRECLLAATALWALLALGGRSADPLALLLAGASAQLVVLHLLYMASYSRGATEHAWFALLAEAALCAAWLGIRHRRRLPAPRWQDAALVLMAALAALEMLGLAFDPRYRHFPVAVFVVPAAVLCVLGVEGTRWRERGRALAALLLACAPAVVWQETLANREALAWLAVTGVLVAGLLRKPAQRLACTTPRSASANSAMTAAGAPRRTL